MTAARRSSVERAAQNWVIPGLSLFISKDKTIDKRELHLTVSDDDAGWSRVVSLPPDLGDSARKIALRVEETRNRIRLQPASMAEARAAVDEARARIVALRSK
jgi:hypothetical protein